MTPSDQQAERLLPCDEDWQTVCCRGDEHSPECPAHYRPAVSAALAEKDGEIDKLARLLSWLSNHYELNTPEFRLANGDKILARVDAALEPHFGPASRAALTPDGEKS